MGMTEALLNALALIYKNRYGGDWEVKKRGE